MMKNQLKQVLLAGVAALNVSVPVFAGEHPDAANAFSARESSLQLFEAGDRPLELGGLSMAEMEATEGAQGVVGAVVGGVLGGGAYAIQHAYTREFDVNSLAANVAGGAAAGVVFPPQAQAARFVWAVNSAMARGVGQGVFNVQRPPPPPPPPPAPPPPPPPPPPPAR